jgi:hypothetical protein
MTFSKQPHLRPFNPRRPEVRAIKRRQVPVEAVAAGERLKSSVDLIREDAGA